MPDNPLIIDTWMDLASLECYLALNSLRRSIAQMPFQDSILVALHPYLEERTGQMTVAESVSGDTSLELPELEESARKSGIAIDWDATLPQQTLTAQQLVLHAFHLQQDSGNTVGAGTLSLRMAESIMRAQFELGANIESPELLVGIAQDLQIGGANASEALRSPILREEALDAYQLALHLGVESPPVFLFDETFVVQSYQTEESFERILTTAWQQKELVEGNTGE